MDKKQRFLGILYLTNRCFMLKYILQIKTNIRGAEFNSAEIVAVSVADP